MHPFCERIREATATMPRMVDTILPMEDAFSRKACTSAQTSRSWTNRILGCELYLSEHELAHVGLVNFGTEHDFGRERVHTGGRSSQSTSGTRPCRGVENGAKRGVVWRAGETSGSHWRLMPTGSPGVDWTTSKGRGHDNGFDGVCGGTSGGSVDVEGVRDDGYVVWVRRVNHGRGASTGAIFLDAI
jgi:hypothetical protein